MAATELLLHVFFCLCIFVAIGYSESLLCTSDFCSDYVDKEGCPTPPKHCSYNNATHKGLSLLSPTPCNCCPYCLPFYGKDEHCSLGGTGDGTTVGRCGDGLTCVKSSDGQSYCQRMDTKCHKEQDDFDKGLEQGKVGFLEARPVCDEKGNYAAFACVPTQTCFCQSEDKERLFGEALDVGSADLQNMNCGCSRLNHNIKKFIGAGLLLPFIAPRCTSDGNFNPVQCVGRECYCVNIITGQIVGNERIKLDEKPVSELSCYKKELDLYPQQNDGDPPYEYTTQCLKEMNQMSQFVLDSIEEGYNMDYYNTVSECLPDGSYGRIGDTKNGTKICLNASGRQLGDYEALPKTEQYDNMDCKCALTNEIMSSSLEKPICCSNGNFRPIQCHRSKCRCVDADGRQVGVEAEDVTKLTCYKANWKNC